MRNTTLPVAWYRFRATFRRRWGGYLALALLIGLLGGIAMASVAAARRTQSSFPAYLASTHPSDLVVSVSDSAGTSDAAGASLEAQLAHLPGVQRAGRFVQLNAAQLGPNGPILDTVGQVERYGSVDGIFFDQDGLRTVRGRRANPANPDEMVLTPEAARLTRLRVGQTVPWGFVTNAQVASGLAGTPGNVALRRDIRVVGLVAFKDEIVQDDVDRFPTAVVFTPALTRLLPPDWAVGGAGGGGGSFSYYGLQLVHGSKEVAKVEKAIPALLPPTANANFHLTSLVKTKVERAVKPESIALGVFGGIAALAVLLIAAQMISRHMQSGDEDRQVLRALGAGSAAAIDGLVGAVVALVAGTLLAAGVAVALSPLSPIGPARHVYPTQGIAADWTVLGLGAAVLALGLGLTAIVIAYWRAPQRVARRVSTGSNLARMATAAGLPAPAMVGVRFALEPGRGRTAVPVRSALTGAALSVVMVVATLTFGNSLRTLVSRPSLYGWNWSYILNGNPWVPRQTEAMLDHDPDVAVWTHVFTTNLQLDGQTVPGLFTHPRTTPAPPVLSGHGLDTDQQVVLGVGTLNQLHKHVGDTVDASAGGTTKRLVIAGTATMPAIGQPIANQDHTTMGNGALVPFSIFTPDVQQAFSGSGDVLTNPGLVLVQMRPGLSPAAALRDVRRIADATNQIIDALPANQGAGNEITLQAVQHPAEIVNYKHLGTTPALLDAGLAAGAIIALGLTLVASVRRRRRDLALFKTFGFTTGQLAATVAWQASVAGAFGIIAGIPLGIAVGRWLWILFAHNIYVVPRPTVPVLSVVLVGIGAIVLANVVAALPGRVAARTPSALLLRAE